MPASFPPSPTASTGIPPSMATAAASSRGQVKSEMSSERML